MSQGQKVVMTSNGGGSNWGVLNQKVINSKHDQLTKKKKVRTTRDLNPRLLAP